MSCPELALDHRPTTALPRPDAPTTASASEALAAIASTYEDARAGIISGDCSPHPLPPPGHSPTVPLTLMSGLKQAQPPQPAPVAGAREAMTALWSRLLRRGGSARGGRHSATQSHGFDAAALQWGPPGRVRFLS